MSGAMKLLRAMNGIRAEDVLMAGKCLEGGKPVRLRKKRMISFALVAALILALAAAAYAVNAAVGTPEAAERVALEQLEKWKSMGILAQEVVLDGPADQIVEIGERKGSDYWYGRIFRHHYDVRWHFGQGIRKYGANLSVDTLTGKITAASVSAVADENDTPTGEEAAFTNERGEEIVWYFYENFDDIFPAELTLDRFCSLLAEYWGFTGYRLGDTQDSFYDTRQSAPDGAARLVELPRSNGGGYVTIYFEGDQDGAPMYLELMQFPGYSGVTIGTGHAVG